MICVLPLDCYEKVRPLFEGFPHTLITAAVIERYCPGSIYVDDTETPKTALIVSPEGYYLAGDHTDSFSEALKTFIDTLIPERLQKGEENVSLNYYPASWEDRLSHILQEKFPLRVHGYTYAFKKLKIPDWRDRIPKGFSIVQVDRFLLSSSLKNKEKVLEWINHVWSSPEDFLRHGVGFCMLHSDTIVSWCLTDCVVGSRCEIGIETQEDYRRQGFASLTVAATVDYCLQKGLTAIDWHTGVTNVGSIRTAEKVGFERVLMDTYYFFWFYPVDNFIEHGYHSWWEGHYGESAQWYERASAVAESGEYKSFQLLRYHSLSSVYLYAAISWARAGETDFSLKNLEKASKIAESPQEFAETLKRSESLKSLHGTEGWKILLEQLEG